MTHGPEFGNILVANIVGRHLVHPDMSNVFANVTYEPPQFTVVNHYSSILTSLSTSINHYSPLYYFPLLTTIHRSLPAYQPSFLLTVNTLVPTKKMGRPPALPRKRPRSARRDCCYTSSTARWLPQSGAPGCAENRRTPLPSPWTPGL